MRVTLVNTLSQGGAANSCIRLHLSLLELGVDSRIIFLFDNSSVTSSTTFYEYHYSNYLEKILNRTLYEKLLRRLKLIFIKDREYKYFMLKKKMDAVNKSKPKGFEVFSFPFSNYYIHEHPWIKNTDILFFYWVNNFLDYSTFFRNNKKPIVWGLSEMFPFTGGCSYSNDCEQYKTECIDCPQLLGSSHPEFVKDAFYTKYHSLKDNSDISVVAPSQWLMEKSLSSRLFGKYPHYLIRSGLDERTFKPHNKVRARELLTIPIDKIVVLFIAPSVDNPRKGYVFFKESINAIRLSNKNIMFCIAGQRSESMIEDTHIKYLGYIDSEDMLSMAYSSADIFVIPSLADNLPCTVREALMCGTPVVAFPSGGIPEMISDGYNGFLCEKISTESLVETLLKTIENLKVFNREEIANSARKEYSQRKYGENYLSLFTKIITS